MMKFDRLRHLAKSRRVHRSRPHTAQIEQTTQPKRSSGGRINLVYGLTFLAFSALVGRLGYLQIANGIKFRTEASTTMLNRMPVLPARGWIYDTNGDVLAYDKPSFSIYLTRMPNDAQNFNSIANQLAPVFHVSAQSFLNTIAANQSMAQIRLFTNLSNSQLAYVEEHKSELPGVNVVQESQRIYLNGDLAGHVLGYVGRITPQTVGYYGSHGYLATQVVGETGLESQYENLLQGSVGYQVVETNNQGTPIKVMGFSPAPTAGNNLGLTLDGHLQAQVQNILMSAVMNSKYRSVITDAEAVVLNVKTGGVLALVSYPYFDPNWYVNGDFTKHVNYLMTSGAQIDHAIQSPRYPGSTVKPANLITGLEQGVISPSTTMYGYSSIRVGTATLHNDGQDNGFVDPIKAIAVSSDTFFYEVGLRLGKWLGADIANGGGFSGSPNYQTWLDTTFARGISTLFKGEWDFGLGQVTGIDLPGEQPGTFYIENSQKQYIREPYNLQTALQALKRSGHYTNYGTPVDLAFAGIGQSQQFTPMELAQYVATIANNGKRIQPHLLNKIFEPGGTKLMRVIQPRVQNVVHARPAYFKLAQEGMYGAVNSPSGTAYGVFLNAPYQVAGKTGTAQMTANGIQVDNSVFIAYAPYNNPQVALAVMVPGGGYGAGTAGPVARQILDTYFQEHHEFFPKGQWQSTAIPSTWAQSPAYTAPEQSH